MDLPARPWGMNKMIHPQYWSLHSIWRKFRPATSVMSKLDVDAYSLLPVNGKTVLDIGAYTGDTAELFLKWGAKKVIAIEPDESRCLQIWKKFSTDKVEIRCRGVEPSDLKRHDYDVIKCDCEGYEMVIIDHIPPEVPAVIESHCWWITDQFKKKGFRIISKPDPMLGICLMANFQPLAMALY